MIRAWNINLIIVASQRNMTNFLVIAKVVSYDKLLCFKQPNNDGLLRYQKHMVFIFKSNFENNTKHEYEAGVKI